MIDLLPWLKYMNEYYNMIKPIPGHENFTIDAHGTVYKNGTEIIPFNSNGYKQICLNGVRKERVIKGVHQLVSMTFDPEYYDGCVVHHLDEVKNHNNLLNLKVEDLAEHSRHHVDRTRLANYNKEHGPHNKGKKMSPEFCEKCRISAIKRAQREREENIKHGGCNRTYGGNQFRNADGTKKEVNKEWYEKFRESCRQAALKRNKK